MKPATDGIRGHLAGTVQCNGVETPRPMPVEAIARFCQGELKIGCMEGESPDTCCKPRCPLYPWRTPEAARTTAAITARPTLLGHSSHRFTAERSKS